MALPQKKDDGRNIKNQRIPADQRRSRSVDWRSETDPQDPYTRTTSNTYATEQKKRLTGVQLLDRDTADKEKEITQRNKRAKIIRHGLRDGMAANNRQIMKSLREVHGTTKGLAATRRKQKALFASVFAGLTCLPLYFSQVSFWVLAMLGFGIEAGAASLSGADANLLEKMAALFLSYALPGQTLFVAGWILSSIIGLFQLFICLGIFTLRRVNAFRGNSMIAFPVIFSFVMLPFGLIPWVHIWIWIVYRANRR